MRSEKAEIDNGPDGCASTHRARWLVIQKQKERLALSGSRTRGCGVLKIVCEDEIDSPPVEYISRISFTYPLPQRPVSRCRNPLARTTIRDEGDRDRWRLLLKRLNDTQPKMPLYLSEVLQWSPYCSLLNRVSIYEHPEFEAASAVNAHEDCHRR